MKTKKLFILPATFLLGALVASGASGVRVAKATSSEFDNLPKATEVSADSYYGNAWHTTVGARRISERGVIVVDSVGWGYRGKISGRTYNLADFNFSIDMSNTPSRAALMVMVASAEGSYCDTLANKITIDIVKHSTDATKYQVTVDPRGNNHAVSIDEWQDGKGWQDDGTYKGRTITAEDGVINFSMKKNNSSVSTVKCNDQEVQVSTTALYANVGESYDGYVSIGLYAGSGEQSFIINSIGDDSDEVYFKTGAFSSVKKGLAVLSAKDYTTISNTDLLQAKLDFDALPWSSLYRWDRAYFNATYTEVQDKINNALLAAGNSIQLDLIENKIDALNASSADLTTSELLDAQLDAYKAAKDLVDAAEELILEGADQTRFDGLKQELAAEEAKIHTAAVALYETAVAAFEAKVGQAITSGMQYAEATNLKGNLPTKYTQYFTDAEYNGFAARIDAASTILESAVVLDNPLYIQGSGAKVITTPANTIDVVSSGNSMDLDAADTSCLFLNEALNVLNFSAKINFAQVPQAIGGWVTMGFMVNPEMWVYSKGDVTNNQGIFFLITRLSSTLLNVETHLCTMSSGSFNDSKLAQFINIPSNQDIDFSFSTETKEVAGVQDTYFNIKFGNVTLDQENITARKIKTVIPVENNTQKGYFFVGSSGFSSVNPAVVQIKDINGFSPLAESHVKQKAQHEVPTSTTTKVTFVNGSSAGKVTLNVDMHEEEIVSLKMDGTDIPSTAYTINDTKIVLNNAYCNTLSVGQHTVTLTTTGGSISWTVDVVSNGNGGGTTDGGSEGDTSSKKGCGGSIIVSSALIATLALAGAGLMLRKKED